MKLNASPIEVFGSSYYKEDTSPNHRDKNGVLWYWMYDEDTGILYQTTDLPREDHLSDWDLD